MQLRLHKFYTTLGMKPCIHRQADNQLGTMGTSYTDKILVSLWIAHVSIQKTKKIDEEVWNKFEVLNLKMFQQSVQGKVSRPIPPFPLVPAAWECKQSLIWQQPLTVWAGDERQSKTTVCFWLLNEGNTQRCGRWTLPMGQRAHTSPF